MEVKEAKVLQPAGQALQGVPVMRQVKYYKDARDFYENQDKTMEDNRVMYEVFHYQEEDDSYPGHLCWGVTVMYPADVCGEYNMTRGHFHNDPECGEIYCGTAGHGLLLIMDDKGKTWAEKVEPGSLHYIRGRWGHRLVNTGDEVFKVTACWPASAGHDYSRIETHPFACRIYKSGSGMEIREQGEGKNYDRQL